MAVEIKFDANQQFQRDAIDSVVELFAGQEAVDQGVRDRSASATSGHARGLRRGRLRQLAVARADDDRDEPASRPGPAVGSGGRARRAGDRRRPIAQAFDRRAADLDFSVEMETGTGKTYVYLRTIAELHLKYGFTKFVIVVPSVAIREGVLSSLRLLKEHIRDLYDGLQYDSYVYDSTPLTRVRQFATASHLQIMVDQHRLLHEGDERHQPADRRDERVRADRVPPRLPADRDHGRAAEPGDADPPGGDPIALARCSGCATRRRHRDLKHLVYRLTPVDAYDLRLVKRIGVLSITKDADLNEAYVEVTKINATPGGVTATAMIHKATKQGTKPTQVTLRKDDDLFELSGERDVYQGWTVEDIHAAHDGALGYVEFGNGRTVAGGASSSAAPTTSTSG